jgi:hypothetical protein
LVEEKEKKEESDLPRPNGKAEYKENGRGKLKETHFIQKTKKNHQA